MKSEAIKTLDSRPKTQDPETDLQEVTDWFTQLVMVAFALWSGALRWLPTILLGAFYAAITSATAIIIIHHLSR